MLAALALAGLAIGTGAGGALAQEDSGGLSVGLTFSARLLGEDGTTRTRSDIAFDILSETRSQRFAFSIGAGAEELLSGTASPGQGTGLQDPFAALSYTLESRSTALTFDADYRRGDVSSLTAVQLVGGTGLILDTGEREDISARLTFEFGREGPFGGELSLRESRVRYIDTISTALQDNDRQNADLVLRFDPGGVATYRLTLTHEDLDRVGGIDLRTDRLTFGVDAELNRSLTAEIDIGVTRIRRGGTATPRTDEGLSLNLSLEQALPNGTLSAALRSDLDENGRRDTIRVGRALDLPRGALSFGVGASHSEDTGNTRPLYDLTWRRDFPRAVTTVSLEQGFSSSSTGAEVLDSRLVMSLEQALTQSANLTARLNLRETEQLATGGTTAQRLDIGLDYTHALNGRWSAIAGITHERQQQTGQATTTDNTIFVGLSAGTRWRP